jgi:hypothetical protein
MINKKHHPMTDEQLDKLTRLKVDMFLAKKQHGDDPRLWPSLREYLEKQRWLVDVMEGPGVHHAIKKAIGMTALYV